MSDKIEVARSVASHLLATEEAIDVAIACAAGLVGYLPVARQQTHVSAAVGQPAFEQVIAAMSVLGEARRRIVEAHSSLAESGRQARIPARNFGGFVDKPSHHAQSGMQVVAESRAA
ncbi:hypothetical protein [Sandarakinorhabdus sp. DWP1-3-1]|uniref:hypothetical protein n=1 Tax=Sandarakinorhabdus sp. DWP1-3-1 TaxID=2804627 RepID=UPI003CF5073F